MNKKLTLCLLLALKCSTQAQTTYPWSNVALGGAGAIVTGTYTLPGAANNIWIRTDVGGVYRFTPTGTFDPSDTEVGRATWGSWTSLTNSFPVEWSEYFACDGFAVNPVATNILYYAGGLDHGRLGALLKSTDGGANWTKLPVPEEGTGKLMVAGTINGNGYNRYGGERMAISPAINPDDTKYVLYGSRRSGLWYSEDRGANWIAATGIPLPVNPTDSTDTGVQCVAFDPSTAGRVYCAVSKKGTYTSTDYGKNWTPMTGGGKTPQRLKVGPNGIAWYTSSDMGIQKGSGSAWSSTNYMPRDPTIPAGTTDGDFCGLAINRLNPNEVVVQQGGAQGLNAQKKGLGKIWRTTVAGGIPDTTHPQGYWDAVNYVPKAPTSAEVTLHTQQTWFGPFFYRFSPADFAFDPTDSPRLRGGQWYCPDIRTTPNTNWYQTEVGHEENVMLCLACPPKRTDNVPIYELLEGSFDDPGLGWMYDKLDIFPSASLPITDLSGTSIAGTPLKSISYCEKMPQNMLRTGGSHYGQAGLVVSRSTNGGNSWTQIPNFPTNLLPMDLAVSSGLYSTNAVVVCHQFYTSDSTGNSWTSPQPATSPFRYTANYQTASTAADWVPVTGLPSTAAPTVGANGAVATLAADSVYASTFYYLEMSPNTTNTSNVWVSTNGGQSFSKRATTLPKRKSQCSLKAQPGTAGSVWAAADDFLTYVTPDPTTDGLYRSTDFGVSFTKLANVTRALSFGFGIGDKTTVPALYLYGKVTTDAREGVFYSTDLGSTWQYISNSTQQLGDGPVLMEGSQQTPNRVFVGTQGRGVFYSE